MTPLRRWAVVAVAVLAVAALAMPLLSLAGASDSATVQSHGDRATGRFLAEAGAGARDAAVVTSTPLALRNDPAVVPVSTLFVVLGATRPYSAEEATALRDFLEAGGRALVAEDDGQAGSLLAPYGLAFERVPLLHAQGDVPFRYAEGAAALDAHARLPTPIILRPGTSAEPVAVTAADAFVDRDSDGRYGVNDPSGPFVLAARVAVGSNGGALVALGSLDLFSDRLADDPAAAAVRASLLGALAPADGLVVLDESHRTHSGGLAAASWIVRTTSETPFRWLAAGAAVLAAVAVAALGSRPSVWGPHRHLPDRFRSRRQMAVRASVPAACDESSQGPAVAGWTARGHAATAGALVLLSAGLVSRSATAVAAGLALGAAVLGAGLLQRPALDARRTMSADRVPEDQEVAVELVVRARRAADIVLRDGVPPEDEVAGPAPWRRLIVRRGVTVRIGYALRPRLRGPHRLGPLRVRVSDPLGLRILDVPAEAGADLKVLPRRDPLKRVRLRVRRPDLLMAAHQVNRAGEGSEFQALREYQPGDALRTVNWKASARSKSLMVNQRVHESQTILTLVLDARGVSDCGPARTTPLACAARALVTIAGAAVQGRDRIRVVLYGAEVAHLPPAPAQRLLHELSTRLATLPAVGDLSFVSVAAQVVATVRPGTPVALFSGLEGNAGFAEGARMLIARGASVTVFAFPVATEGTDGESDLGGEAIQVQRQRNMQALRGAGATVHDVQAGLPLEALLQMQGVTR